jgi:chaperonin cofactor prefoldin
MKETYETKLTKENELKLKIEVLEQQVRDYQCQVESLKEELKELNQYE